MPTRSREKLVGARNISSAPHDEIFESSNFLTTDLHPMERKKVEAF
jgi:hypothetical protein